MPITKKVNKDFFKKWSREMAYVLGFMYADGNLIKNNRGAHFFAIYSSDEDLIKNILECMKSNHKISVRNKKQSTKPAYSFQIGSKEMFLDLGKLGLIPNKSRRMILPDLPVDYIGDFLRGYFDGDGNVWTGKIHKGGLVNTVTINTAFTSISILYLKALHSLLKTEGIQGGSIYTSKTRNYSRLTFSVRDSLKLYKIMYNRPHKLYLNRKKLVFERYMSLRL